MPPFAPSLGKAVQLKVLWLGCERIFEHDDIARVVMQAHLKVAVIAQSRILHRALSAPAARATQRSPNRSSRILAILAALDQQTPSIALARPCI